MKILVVVCIVVFIVFAVWYAKSQGETAEFVPNNKLKEISDVIDSPIDFGYKTGWIAAKTNDKIEVAKIINLKNVQASNWKSGLEYAAAGNMFISPQIGEWTLVLGGKLPYSDSIESIEQIEIILNALSVKFGEAHFFGTHRGVGYHNWMKSKHGKMERIYAVNIGECAEIIKIVGKPTTPEIGLNLFTAFSEDLELSGNSGTQNLKYADEEMVMQIAEFWSLNPTKLSERLDVKKELGCVGRCSW